MDPDPTTGLSDPSSNLQKFQSERSNLGIGKLGPLEVSAQQQKQAVGKGVKEQPELIGDKAMTTEPIGLEFKLQSSFLP